jgi:thymidylate synthase ThyX
MPSRSIYLLSSRALPPETIAVAFAKTSRSPDSFRAIAGELTEEKSARFHEKWVIGFGHASVAEHAVLHIAIENVSRLAVECLESNRLASFTEKSTRFQSWDPGSFILPPELEDHPMREAYLRAVGLLFERYGRSLTVLRARTAFENPRQPGEAGEAYERRLRSLYIDSCRFLLPAAALANLGMTANARVLEHAICKLLSHPLLEVRQIGDEMKKVAQVELPTLLRYAEVEPEQVSPENCLIQPAHPPTPGQDPEWCRLVAYDPQGEDMVLAAVLYRFGALSFSQAQSWLRSATSEERSRLAGSLLDTLGPHSLPPRELEHTQYTFDLVLDQGAYAEFKRHRMMTQTPQALTTRLGFVEPSRMRAAGFEAAYREAMQTAAETYELLAGWNPAVASYVVPNGFLRRVLFTLNLREAYAFCQLRASPNAHFSMRRVAQRVAEAIRQVHPTLAAYMHLPDQESWQGIEQQYL